MKQCHRNAYNSTFMHLKKNSEVRDQIRNSEIRVSLWFTFAALFIGFIM